MNIQIEEIDYCKVFVKYEADTDAISNKKTEIVNKLRSQPVPGFRKGNATDIAIRQHFKKEIFESLKQELAMEAVSNVVMEKNIKPFGYPAFSSINLEESRLISIAGEPAIPKFNCQFTLHIQPEFDLKEYKGFEIPKAHGIMPGEELAQKMIQELRTKHGNTIPYGQDDFVQMGDTIIVDLKTIFEDKVMEKFSGNGEILNVGRINIPGFSENILGMRIGETREFELTMPDSHSEHPGKPLNFSITLNMGSKMEPSALDDDFAKKLGLENIDKLMDEARATAGNRTKELETSQNFEQIAKRLIEHHDFKIPDWISTSEAKINAQNAGLEWDKISDEDKQKQMDNANNSIKLSLILNKVRENEPDAQLTDQEVVEIAKKNISQYAPQPDQVLGEMVKNGHIHILLNRIRDEYTLSFIEKNSKIIE